MTPALLEDIQEMSPDQKRDELSYMATTIPSSWEFVSTTFLITGVTRAAAQQITRTRQASYAMQSQRVTKATEVMNPYKQGTVAHEQFGVAVDNAMAAYEEQLEHGCAMQDARGILPMNTLTNIVARYNLRALVDVVTARKSARTQNEYAVVIRAMERAVLKAWPWAAPFFTPNYATAIAMLDEIALDLGITPGTGLGWRVAKAADLIRKES